MGKPSNTLHGLLYTGQGRDKPLPLGPLPPQPEQGRPASQWGEEIHPPRQPLSLVAALPRFTVFVWSFQVRRQGQDCGCEIHWLSMGRLSSSSTCRARSMESSRSQSPSGSSTESVLREGGEPNGSGGPTGKKPPPLSTEKYQEGGCKWIVVLNTLYNISVSRICMGETVTLGSAFKVIYTAR